MAPEVRRQHYIGCFCGAWKWSEEQRTWTNARSRRSFSKVYCWLCDTKCDQMGIATQMTERYFDPDVLGQVTESCNTDRCSDVEPLMDDAEILIDALGRLTEKGWASLHENRAFNPFLTNDARSRLIFSVLHQKRG